MLKSISSCKPVSSGLNSFIGLAITEVTCDEIKNILVDLQNKLFVVGSDLATPEIEKNKKLKITRTPDSYILEVEQAIDNFEFSTNFL